MIRLAVRVRREQAEIVLAELLELAPAGIEEVTLDESTVEYAIYGAPGEIPSLPALDAVAGDALVEISTSEIAEDWQERWKLFHRPILLLAPSRPPTDESPPHSLSSLRAPLPALHVRPPWEQPAGAGHGPVREIVIDPGQAFGTGAHASTRMCLELLLQLAAQQPPQGQLLDIGTGSGVLAIAAAALGFGPVLGLDYEQESVRAAGENALVNGVQIEVRRFDLRTQTLPWLGDTDQLGIAPVVLANLLRPLLLELAATMHAAPAQLVVSGLLVAEVDEIVAAFSGRLGLRERERRISGEWAAVWLAPAETV